MPAPDREKLLAGLSGILSGAPPAEDALDAAAGRADLPPAAADPEPKGRSVAAPAARPSPRAEAEEEGGEHIRTTTGYVRAGGERVHRVSVMLTKAERRRLRDLAEDEGVTITDLVRRALNL